MSNRPSEGYLATLSRVCIFLTGIDRVWRRGCRTAYVRSASYVHAASYAHPISDIHANSDTEAADHTSNPNADALEHVHTKAASDKRADYYTCSNADTVGYQYALPNGYSLSDVHPNADVYA